MKPRPLGLVVFVMLAGAALLAQAPPFGTEFQVNAYTTNSQDFPSIGAGGVTGSFVVSWRSGLQDGDKGGIFLRRFNALGPFLGSEIPVNTITTGEQNEPAVGVAANDNFVIAWDSDGVGPFDARASCQRFSGGGSTINSQFDANASGTNVSQVTPAIAMRGSGEFVVAWDEPAGILAQRYDAFAGAVGSNFLNTYVSPSTQFAPDVAMNSAGQFVVVRMSFYQLSPAAKTDIFGQVFDSDGNKVGSEFQVNTFTDGVQGIPRVAIHKGGDFVVVWHSGGEDGSDYGVFGQRFNAAGEKIGSEFPVNSYTPGRQYVPSVAAEPDGGFVVVWQSKDEDGSDYGIFGQRFDRSGARVGSEFAINTYTTAAQMRPRVAETGQGIALVWASGGQDGSASGIFARREEQHPEALVVDAHGVGSSDLNGVFEPGEAVVVEPSWRNNAASAVDLGGTVAGGRFTGPAGPNYQLLDSSTSYGSVPKFSTASCQDASPNACYAVQLGGSRPGVHWDAVLQEDLSVGGSKLWTLHVGDSFTDVPRTQPFYRKIETMLHHGITLGCGGTSYCPGTVVARDQMAIFIAKGLAGSGELVPSAGSVGGHDYDCKNGGASLFSDVAPNASDCKHVHYLAAQNVTLGCGPATYCPSQPVTRDAMASFIAKALVAPDGGNAVPAAYGPDPVTGRSYSCNAGSANLHFTDVGVLHPFCKHIHFLWAKGVVDGCSVTTYCPSAPVARDAMAKFIANGFGLQLYGP